MSTWGITPLLRDNCGSDGCAAALPAARTIKMKIVRFIVSTRLRTRRSRLSGHSLNLNQFGAVWRDNELELIAELSEAFLPPKIPHRLLARDIEVRPFDSHRHCAICAGVEQTDRFRAVFQIFCENANVTVLDDGRRLLAERVLTDGEHLVVFEHVQGEGRQFTQ